MNDPYKKRYFYLMFSIFGAIALSILLFFIVYRFDGINLWLNRLSGILAPFIYGSVLAYLLRPLCNHYENLSKKYLPKKLKAVSPGVAVFLSIVTALLLVHLVISMIIPQLYNSILNFWDALPSKVEQFLAWARGTFGSDERLLNLFNQLYNYFYAELENWVKNTMMPYLTNIIGGVGSSVYMVVRFLYNMLIGLIVACYLLYSRRQFARQSTLVVHSVLPPRWAKLLLEEVTFVDRMFGGFVDGKILDSAIIGLLCYIGCMICRFPNALLVSAIVGITNVIPFFGPFIGAVPATLLIMMESPVKGLWFIVFVLALQQLDGNVIGPKILGDRTGLSSFWVLFAILLFGGLWGIAGMLICVPVFAVIYDLIKRGVQRGLRRRNQESLWNSYKADYPDEEKK